MLQLFLIIVVIGVILWFVEAYIPMAPPFKAGLRVLGAIFILLILLQAFGVVDVPVRPLFR